MYELAHAKVFDRFIDYMISDEVKKKLDFATDILPDMLYTYVRSPDKVHIGRAILWLGNGLRPEWSDAQLNLEYDIDGKTYLQIRYHKKAKIPYMLSDPKSWEIDNP